MTQDGLQVRRLAQADIDSVVTFHHDLNIAVSRAQLLWEFFDKKLIREGIIIGALDGRRLVGTQAFIPYKALADGAEVLSAKSELTLLHPDYRGKQLFQRMYELGFEQCVAAGLRCIWGFTSARKPFEKVGFDFRGQLLSEYVVLRPVAAWRALRTGWQYQRGLSRPTAAAPPAMRDQRHRPFSLVRDHAYLEHRYVDNPARLIGAYDPERQVLFTFGGRMPQCLFVSECVDRADLSSAVRKLARFAAKHWFAIARIGTRPALGWMTVPGAAYTRRPSPSGVVFKWLGQDAVRPIPDLDIEEGYTEGVH